MNRTQASSHHFVQMAEESETLRVGYFPEAVREAAIAAAYLRPELVVADIGTGTGFIAAGLAPLVRQVIAVDGSAAMLAVAQRNLAAFENVTYRVADGAALPFADGSLDAVFANMYLHHCPEPLAALTEMVRVLRPGGRLVLTDLDQHTHTWMREEMADAWLGFDRGQVKIWLRQVGLVNRIVDCTSQPCCADAATDASADQAQISVFVATGSRRVSGAREAVQANYGAVAASGASCCGSDPTASAQSDCCAPTNAMPLIDSGPELVLYETGYTPDQLDAIPVAAAGLSLGCGNPTAIASLKPGEVVLDIGSGAGIDAFFAARRVGAQGRVIGLDMTPAMIERARQSAAAAGFANVEFRLGQAEAMPVESATVDVILSNCVINLAEDKGQVFEEAHRVLKPGGRLSISDMVTAGPLPIDARGDARLWSGCVNGALPEQEYLALVQQAGFTDVTAKRSLSGGELAGVQVYSISVSARKLASGSARAALDQ